MPIQILARLLYKRNSVKANEGQCFESKFALIQFFYVVFSESKWNKTISLSIEKKKKNINTVLQI